MLQRPMRQDSDQPHTARAISGLTGAAVAAALVLACATNEAPANLDALTFALVAIPTVALLVASLRRREAIPAVLLVIVLAAAYVPSAWSATSVGFPHSEFRATSYGLVVALAAWTAQMLVTWGAGYVAATWTTPQPTIARALHRLSGDSSHAVTIGMAGLVILNLVGALRDGSWSLYRPGNDVRDEMALAGGFRVALLYSTSLFAMCALVANRIAAGGLESRLRSVWYGIAALTLLGLFALQSRRLMFASVLLLIFAYLSQHERRPGRRVSELVGPLVLVALVGGAMFYGSFVWRSALHTRSDGSLGEHVSKMAQTNVDRSNAVSSVRQRLSYLWLDSAAVEVARRVTTPRLLERALVAEIESVVPGVLYPDKYRREALTCETVLMATTSSTKRMTDLPCTALSEGIIFGGAAGLAWVLLAWGLPVFVAGVLQASRSPLGAVMASLIIEPMLVIETSAFPFVRSLRNTILMMGLLLPLVWLARQLLARRGEGLSEPRAEA
jgi:hypothetical protein